MEYFSSLKPKLIYIFRIPDSAHSDCLKIGETTFEDGNIALAPNSSILNKAAKARIDQYTKTAGVPYELLHTEIAITVRNGAVLGFNDKEVHEVLLRSGVKRKLFDRINGANEWFVCDLATAKRAIEAVKEGRKALNHTEITETQSPIVFRPEQREAIDKTLRQFKKGNQMLWNAKMRFGKTLSALQVVKEQPSFRRVLILTHRPVVDAGWFDDFKKIFYDTPDFAYGSKENGETFKSLESQCRQDKLRYVYFASMQDLRGSELVGGHFDKNNDIFATPWDLIIVDEAHEGTQTDLGRSVMTELIKEKTKVLRLSGTPFNLLDNFKEEEIYTWDYVMEQRAKADWDLTHPGDPNPYAGLPRLNIYTYDLGRLMNEFADEDIAFNFREFFRTNDNGEFVHLTYVNNFLNLLTKTDEESMYPFANKRYRDIFRHTLWMLPGVKAAKALSVLLQNHPVFGLFNIVNVAGDGDEEEAREEALKKVENAIGKDPDATRTITLSCGRLTTGVSVKPWMGVFMLSGSFNTAAAAYMQTIFRVQTPATINGRVKEDCYVFDFAPDRTLKVLAETAKISHKAGKQTSNDRQQLGEFLNFCPIIAVEGSKMTQMNTERMLQQLKRVYVERVVQNGFEDGFLYNDELMRLNDVDIKEFNELKGIIGQTKAMGKATDIVINRQGLTDEEYKEAEDLQKKPKRELTEEERKRLEELKKKKKVKDDAISILRGISIRMPLLIYGADITDEDKELTIDNFTSLVDPQSWEEFMPRGVTKQRFNAFKKYYDPDIFTAAAKRIRQMARAADHLTIEERIERISAIFATFRNPDKETVLTPWRVVNMHLSDTLGGYTFFDEAFKETIEEPRFVEHPSITDDIFSTDSTLLEINSKSGLYPLYLTYNIYRSRLREEMFSPSTLEEHLAVWDKSVSENIFVICKTPMAKAITRRTLLGFRKCKTNMWAPDDLINKIKNQPELFIKKVHDLVGKDVKIKAIVGNPPYQEMQTSEKTGDKIALAGAIYPAFINMGITLHPDYISFITPSRWLSKGGRGISDEWVEKMLNSNRFIKLHDFVNAEECFNNVEIKGGVNYFLYSDIYKGKCDYYLHSTNEVSQAQIFLNATGTGIMIRDTMALELLRKVRFIEGDYYKEKSFSDIVGPSTLFCDCSKGILDTNWTGYQTTFDESHPIKFYLNKSLDKSGCGWISKEDMPKGHEYINKNKVFIPKAGGTGRDTQILGRPFLGEPNSICSRTYLCIGYNQNYSREECETIIKYIETRFFRYFVSLRKNTQDAFAQVYTFVPLQDFTENSDIDWSKSVEDIDRQLYKKYGLNEEEIGFIESMIKPMS